MSVYDPLRDYLLRQVSHEFELSFYDIETIMGRPLPQSAQRPQWWANQIASGHPQREAWRVAGFDAFLISGSGKVKFKKVN